MKVIQSTVETIWKEIVKVELTAEEKLLMHSTNEEDEVAKKALIDRIKSERELGLDVETSSIAQSIYETNKPTLKSNDTYQLIAVDMQLEGEVGKGIINCRVNEEHKQIRFFNL